MVIVKNKALLNVLSTSSHCSLHSNTQTLNPNTCTEVNKKCIRTHRFTSLIFFFLNYCIPLKTWHTVIKKTGQNKAKGGEKKAGFGKADVRTSQANV